MLKAHRDMTPARILTGTVAVVVGLASCGHEASPRAGKPSDARYALSPQAGVFVAAPPTVRARGEIGPSGMTLRGDGGAWQVSFTTVGYACDGRQAPLERTGATASPSPARVEFASSAGGAAVTEWYEQGHSGIEHGFTLEGNPCEAGEQITIEERVAGLAVEPSPDGRGVDLQDVRGAVRVHYTDLAASDARGVTLPSSMVATTEGVTLRVDTRAAAFPVTVDPLAWFQVQKLVVSSGSASDEFGAPVRFSGDTAIFGAPGYGGGVGAAYVFVRSGGVWSEQQTLTPGDPTMYFGSAVAIEGDTALVGAPDSVEMPGAAYVFVRSAGTWMQQQRLSPPSGAPPNFGIAVAMQGTIALVSASSIAPIPTQGVGTVYVYAPSGVPWTEQQALQASDSTPLDAFGLGVDLSGVTAVVSAHSANIGSNIAQGAAYVFVQSGTGFTQLQKLVASDGAPSDAFGTSVAVDGSTVLVGAPQATAGATPHEGAAYVFTQSGGSFLQSQKLVESAGASGDEFGGAVAVSGTVALVGSTPSGLSSSGSGPGQAYFFTLAAGSWTQAQRLFASDGVAGDGFGVALATDGALALVGASGANIGSNARQGAVYAEALLSQTGGTCAADSACGSGHCVDGVCCDSACGLQCQACDVAGHIGTCTTVSGSPHPQRTPCASSGPVCGGSCDGKNAGACLYPTAGTACATACTGNEETDSACDGKGACVPGAPATCRNNLRCDATTGACYAACSRSAECAGGYVCAAGKCAPGAGCIDTHTSQGAAGAQDCRPYTCDSVTGLCNSACTTVDQCSAPGVCDFTGACVPPPDTSVLAGGCSISAVPPAKAPLMAAFASLAMAWALRSRASRRGRVRARAGASS